ncbi:hypothetical protein TKK_0009093 [Trichogramma kaykai]|uniref:poly(A)-specific ribonuclease n=1 Tax=Trichogramma kaykai TaxID=54128 RepID=A0ABD2X3U7_9HYME
MLPICKQNITEVWSYNLIKAFKDIRDEIKNTSFVAFDSEFPGTLLPRTREIDEWTYINGTVPHTNPIQFGLAFYGEFGNKIIPINTWQINFKFDEDTDKMNPDGIKFLKKHGFDFNRHKNEGVSHEEFRKLLVDTGIFGSNNITWVTFYGNFDIAYLLKLCANRWFDDAQSFLATVSEYFPSTIDVKVLIEKNYIRVRSKGLLKLASELRIEVNNVEQAHHAGFDAQVTFACFNYIYNFFNTMPSEFNGKFLYLNVR